MPVELPPTVQRNGTRLLLRSPSGFIIEATTGADDGVLAAFYADYDQAFVLENEKEALDGFVACHALNHGDAYVDLVQRYGPFREFTLIVRDATTQARLAGANFIIFPVETLDAAGPVLSMNLSYVFVNVNARKQGVFARLVRDMPSIAFRLFAETNAHDLLENWLSRSTADPNFVPPLYMFIEQNDPDRMSAEDYARDTAYTGLDQRARNAMWTRLGARIIDFPYVQPPLSAEQEADDGLFYGVIGYPEPRLSACLLREHLLRFFGVSVLKGQPISTNAAASRQIARLGEMCQSGTTIALR